MVLHGKTKWALLAGNAIKMLEDAIRIDKNYRAAYANLAKIYQQRGEPTLYAVYTEKAGALSASSGSALAAAEKNAEDARADDKASEDFDWED